MARSAVGGLLQGLGEALVTRAKNDTEDLQARRDAAIQEARDWRLQNARMAEQAQSDTAQSARDATNNEARRNLISTTITDSKHRVHGLTAGGTVTDLGIDELPPKGSRADDETGLSPGDKRLWDVVKFRHTTKGGLGGEDQVDYDAMADDFKEAGRLDLAKIASPAGRKDTSGVDMNDPAYAKAEEQANAWISSQAGWFSPDSSDFKDFGGNREQARAAKVTEFYDRLKGRKPAADAPASGGGAARVPAASGKTTAPAASATKKYTSAEDVRAAFKRGELKREDATRILREQFDYQ